MGAHPPSTFRQVSKRPNCGRIDERGIDGSVGRGVSGTDFGCACSGSLGKTAHRRCGIRKSSRGVGNPLKISGLWKVLLS